MFLFSPLRLSCSSLSKQGTLFLCLLFSYAISAYNPPLIDRAPSSRLSPIESIFSKTSAPLYIESNKNKSASKVSLVSDHLVASAGSTLDLGIRIDLEKGWHTYWKNAGDIGKPIEVKWKASPSLTHSELKWPRPQRIKYDKWTNFGYKDQVTLLTKWHIPSNFKDSLLYIEADIKWLICQQICLPMRKIVRFIIPVEKKSDIDLYIKNQFQDIKSSLPQDSNLQGVLSDNVVQIKSTESFELIDFFPLSQLSHSAPVISKESDFLYSFSLPKITDKEIIKSQALVVFKRGNRIQSSYVSILSSKKTHAIFIFILMAFLGGLILNAMPCVLPVLFLKFYHLAKNQKDHSKKRILSSLAYASGIVFSFLTLGILVQLLKKGSDHIGWGFQMQSPFFVSFLILFFALIAGNFLGLFRIHIKLKSMNWDPDGLISSFFTGSLITLAASPCTVPFMGAAVGYALSSSLLSVILIFTSLGLGMASPFVLLAFYPNLVRKLPHPGAWSEKLKQAMSLPMLITAGWLLYILYQLDSRWILPILLALLGYILILWVLSQKRTYITGLLLLILLITSVSLHFYPVLLLTSKTDKTETYITDALGSQKFSPILLDNLRTQNLPVLLYFTADWCLTCKVNQWTTFNSKEIQTFIKKNKIKVIKGDWTRSDPDISMTLKKYGRAGLPFSIFFPKDKKDFVILPEVLSPQILKSHIQPLL